MGAGLQINWVVAMYAGVQFAAWVILTILIDEVVRDIIQAACHQIIWI